MKPRGVDLEILERTDDPAAVRELNVIIPNDVTINGLPVLVPQGTEVEVTATDNGGVIARLSLFVGKLRVGAEPRQLDEATPIHDAAAYAVYGSAGFTGVW